MGFAWLDISTQYARLSHSLVSAIMLFCAILTFSSFALSEVHVRNIDEFNNAVANASPGDIIVLANGIWDSAELVVDAEGTKDQPILITVEDKGEVFLEGQSNLKIAGNYINVEGLVFRNGYTPTGAVISYRVKKGNPCNNCRVSECVIDDYNPPERFDQNYWVELYGKNNRIDHCYLVAKRNRGVTIAVRLSGEEDRENNHRIDHNYFGYRPTLGSNGGETLRIGTSHYSMSNSNTIVEDNYFERCSGELEIISSKSCQNVFRNNSFFECQGTLTMRHGNETIVDNNYFFGNRKANTGGIRIINEKQTVTNNYLQGLTGHRFRSALVIMNGVPNSPLNRYFQVVDSKASNNLIINCDNIQLCAGSDEERSAVPIRTEMSNNVIVHDDREDIFTVYDDISGIRFRDNLLSPNILPPSYEDRVYGTAAFASRVIELQDKDGIRRPKGCDVGPILDRPIPDASNTGVSWYPKKNYHVKFGSGEIIYVTPGENTLYEAVLSSSAGDVLVLSSGAYHSTKIVNINHPVTIRSEGENKPILTFERPSLFTIQNGGSLSLDGIKVDGSECDDYAGNAVIRTSKYSMIDNYKLGLKNCDFKDLDVNHSFNVLTVYKNTFADSISLVNCSFDNISGHVLNLNKEIDDIGIYNAENVVVNDCSFKDIGGSAIHLYRGGRDESTFGPILQLSNTTFENVGNDQRNKVASAVSLHGVQLATLESLRFKNSRKLNLHLIVGDPIIELNNINFDGGESIESNDPAYLKSNITYQKSE